MFGSPNGPTQPMPAVTRSGVTIAPCGRQGVAARAGHARRRPRLALLLASALAGCAQGGSLDPVDWWHRAEGGPIAETRPPPPNADAPYPTLASVPPKPPPPDRDAQRGVARALVSDRANSRYAESIDPIPPAPARPAAPQPVDADSQPNATLAAADAQPRPAPAPPPAAPAPASAAKPSPAPVAKPVAATPAVAAALPAMPDAPPPPPSLAGVAVPPVVPAPAPVASPPPPPPLPTPGAPATFAFAAGSAELPNTALPAIKLLARQRGAGTISVTGFGEAASTDPEAQAAALPLGLARARAVAAGLLAAGVPSAALRLGAAPQGSGAVAQISY